MLVSYDGKEIPAQILCQSSLLPFAVAVISIDVARNKNTRPLQWRESGHIVYLLECDVPGCEITCLKSAVSGAW